MILCISLIINSLCLLVRNDPKIKEKLCNAYITNKVLFIR